MENIYQLKISITGSEPLIWRRIQVKASSSFHDLHYAIQVAIGWQNSHLYSFICGDEELSAMCDDPFYEDESTDAAKVTLHERIQKEGDHFTYLYDFGDNWEHLIEVEAIMPAGKNAKYPKCIDGKYAGPPEDCGGIYGYADLLEVLKDLSDPEYAETIEWLGGSFDPTYFPLKKLQKSYGEQIEELRRYEEEDEVLPDVSALMGIIKGVDLDAFSQLAGRNYGPDRSRTAKPLKKSEIKTFAATAYTLRATLSNREGNVRGFPYREFILTGDTDLASLADAVLDLFAFDHDHLYGFYNKWKGRYYDSSEVYGDCTHSSSEEQCAHEITVAQVFNEVKKKMLFLFDFGDEWRFIIQVKKIEPIQLHETYPKVLKCVGEPPEQYPESDEW